MGDHSMIVVCLLECMPHRRPDDRTPSAALSPSILEVQDAGILDVGYSCLPSGSPTTICVYAILHCEGLSACVGRVPGRLP